MSRQWGLRALTGVMSKLRWERGPWTLVFGFRIPQISSVFSMGTSSQLMGHHRRQWLEPRWMCLVGVGGRGTNLHPGGL